MNQYAISSLAANTLDTLPVGRVSKIIQIHPSLQCNLTCRHCYSGSAPTFKGGLEVYPLQQRTEELALLGYNAISLSGGEPFLYRQLEELLVHTRSLGFFNSITTNAMLLGSNRAKRILQQADLIAISVDGKPNHHDELRNFSGAFRKMEEGLQIVKDQVPAFGFIHTLFPENWTILEWLFEFAIQHKAGLLHIHPLEMIGRAASSFESILNNAEELHKSYVIFHLLKELHQQQLVLQLDLLHRDQIVGNPGFLIQPAVATGLSITNFSQMFEEIIIDEVGDIIPIAHGCSKHFKLGNIYDSTSCNEMVERFIADKINDITNLYQATNDHIAVNEEIELLNWSEEVIRMSHQLFGNPISRAQLQHLFV